MRWNDLTSGELVDALGPRGLSPLLARRVFAALHRPGCPADLDLRRVKGIPHATAAAIGPAASGRLELVDKRRSAPDGFVKYLFRLPDGAAIESVLIPLPAGPDTVPDKYTLCISSQAGCALACVFCATGRLGLTRSLETWEIVDQVAHIRDDVAHIAPVRGLVFMGQGEPFQNYDNVLRAAQIFSDPAGFAISAKAITISTAGIVPMIRRFTEEQWNYRLAISLTSAIEEKRRALMPIEARFPLDDLLAAAKDYALRTRTRVTLEYVTIAGVNVGEEDARALCDRLVGFPLKLNLIDVNDATGRYAPPTEAELSQFRTWLEPLGQPIVRRYSGGKEVAGACGMLAADHLAQISPRRLDRSPPAS